MPLAEVRWPNRCGVDLCNLAGLLRIGQRLRSPTSDTPRSDTQNRIRAWCMPWLARCLFRFIWQLVPITAKGLFLLWAPTIWVGSLSSPGCFGGYCDDKFL